MNQLCREMVDQLQWGERQRRGAVTLWFGQPVDDMFGVTQLQTLERKRRAGTVAQQALPDPKRGRRDRARRRAPRHLARSRCSVGWGSKGSHFADIVRFDQPAAGEPAQHPHAYLLGDGGDGLWCQFSGGAKAHGFRGIIGIRDRLEDSVDDAAVTNPLGADLGVR